MEGTGYVKVTATYTATVFPMRVHLPTCVVYDGVNPTPPTVDTVGVNVPSVYAKVFVPPFVDSVPLNDIEPSTPSPPWIVCVPVDAVVTAVPAGRKVNASAP